MSKASTLVRTLSELVEKPENLSRWRVLPGRDYNFQELSQKASAIEEFLSAKEDQAYEKDLILEEVRLLAYPNYRKNEYALTERVSCCFQVTVLADDMLRRVALSRPEAKKIGIKFNAFVRQLSTVSRQIMASVSELSLVQVTD